MVDSHVGACPDSLLSQVANHDSFVSVEMPWGRVELNWLLPISRTARFVRADKVDDRDPES